MTISDLLSNLEPLWRLHPLTPVNVASIYYDGRAVTVAAEDSELESMAEELAEARSCLEQQEEERAVAEAKRDEMEAKMIEAARKADEKENAGRNEAMEESRRWRELEAAWYVEIQSLREEVTKLRKKKGVAAGLIGQQSAILSFMERLAHSDSIDLRERANEILAQIYKQ